ncbi:MAG: DUF3857 domain-containing protein [Terriglobales bacterium]|jgi:hypothetical protein
MTSEPKAPGAPAIILFREVDRDDGGTANTVSGITLTAHEDIYLRIKILTEEGRKYADIEIPYWKDAIGITKLHARTIKPDGSIVDFDGKVFDKTIVKALGVRYLAKTFTLSDVAVGGIIEYFYTIDFSARYAVESHWILTDELFTKSAKFSLKPRTGSFFHLRVQWNLPAGMQPVIAPNHDVHLEARDIAAFHVEDFMPPENELKARVDFIYTNSYESDPDKYWKQFGKQCNDWFESFIGKPKVMEQAVAQIVSSSDSPEVKLEKIYARVQQLRNLTYEAAKTEQEKQRSKEKSPNNVEEVWKWQRGSAVDLTWLFAGLARAAGIETYGAWVSDRSNYFFDPKTMDGNRLNSNVALVKVNAKDVYFDPGSAFVPFGMLPWSETGVSGYKLDNDGGVWIKTTLPDSSQSRIERKAELKLTDEGDLEGKLKATFTGLEASHRRVEERFADDAARKKFLEDEVKGWIPSTSEVELTNQPDWKSSSPAMVAEFTLKVPGWVSGAGRRALLPVGLFGATEKHLFDHAERVHPIYFAFPFQRVDDVTIELPLGWQILNVPAPQKNDGHVVVYTSKAEINKGTLELHRVLNVDIMIMEAQYYPALRDFFQVVRTADEQQVMLQPSSASARN